MRQYRKPTEAAGKEKDFRDNGRHAAQTKLRALSRDVRS